MFGRGKKDPNRVKRLVKNVRSSRINLSGVSEDFLKNYDQISDKLGSKLANSTEDQYYLSFSRFSEFCVQNNVVCLPSEPEVIMTYLIKVSQESKSAAAAFMARSAIRNYNLLHSPHVPSPTDSADVVMLIKCIRREFSHPVHKVEDMTKDILKRLIDFMLKGDQMREDEFFVGIDDWMIVAMTVLKFHTFARFEEAVELKKSSIVILPSGDIEVTFLKAKNNQFHDVGKCMIAASDKKNDMFCPVRIISKYLLRIDSEIDHFFVPKISNGQVYLEEKASYGYCLDKYRRALRLCGVDNWKEFGEHSDRIGGLSAAANAGCSIEDLQVQGRWKSDAMVKIYHKRSLERKMKVSKVLNSL